MNHNVNISNKYFLPTIILGLVLIIGCDTNSISENKFRTEYEKKVEEEIASGVINNEIFMVFKLGDSQKEVRNKFKKLSKDGKIAQNKDGEYFYEFVFNEYEFFNGYATFFQSIKTINYINLE